MKPHSTSLSCAFDAATRLSSSPNEIGSSAAGGSPAVDVPHRVVDAALVVLARIGGEELQVLVHRARDHVEVEPLGRLRLLEHEQRQALGRGVGQPLLDGEPVALGLGDLVALLVQEQLVDEALGRHPAERAADLGGQGHRVDQVLAAHLVVDAERGPAQRPVGLPLALDAPARDRRLDLLPRLGIDVGDGAPRRAARQHRHLQDAAADRRDRQERRVGGAALGAQGRQDDVHHLVVDLEHPQQRRVEQAGLVALGRRQELVLEAELVEEARAASRCCGAQSSDTRWRRDRARR